MTNQNEKRAARAKRALCHVYGRAEVRLEPECAVIDILTDLRHFCDSARLAFGELDRIAHGHYVSERGEARHGDSTRNR